MIRCPMPDRPPEPPPPAPSPTDPADARPDPPRFRWLKRGGLALAGVALALLALRLIAGWHADRRLMAAESSARAKGWPVEPNELDEPILPDADNAAFYLSRAAAALKFTPAQQAALDRTGVGRIATADLPLLRAAVAANAKPLADVRVAAALSRASWGQTYRTPVVASMNFSHLSDQRQLAEFVGIAAGTAALDGDSAEAVRRVRDLLRIGRAQAGSMVATDLIGGSITALGTAEIEALLPNLSFGSASAGGGTRPATRPADRAAVLGLIALLLDDESPRRRTAAAVEGDRVLNSDMARILADAWALRPLFLAEAAASVPRLEAVRPLALHPTGASADSPALVGTPADGPFGFFQFMDSDLSRYVLSLARVTAERRLAAAALAVRLYQFDHAGRLPPTLADLVPAYLPSVPADPFRADGGPIGYAPSFTPAPPAQPAPSPRVYSVGDDGADDGGAGDPDRRWQTDVSPDVAFRLAPAW